MFNYCFLYYNLYVSLILRSFTNMEMVFGNGANVFLWIQVNLLRAEDFIDIFEMNRQYI